MLEQQLQEIIHQDIPLTRAMGLKVKEITADSVSLMAPIEQNVNHQHTAFGGSLFSLAVLSGWCLLLTQLESKGLDGNIVIQDSEIKYLLPVSGDIVAHCQITNSNQLNRFFKMYQRKGMARIRLEVKIMMDEAVAVQFSGNYVVNS